MWLGPSLQTLAPPSTEQAQLLPQTSVFAAGNFTGWVTSP